MLSPNASIFGNLSHATSKALLGLQRSTNKALSVSATEVAITKGNSGDASYSARMSSLSDRKKIEVQNIQNFLTYAQNTGFNGGVSLRWNLFEAQRRDTRVQNAQLNVDSQNELLRQAQNDFLTNITNAYNTYVNSLYVVNMQKRNVVTNELNFERTQDLFSYGQITNVQFRDAQLNLFQAKATYNNARFLAKIAEINLIQLSGKLLE